MKSLWDFLRTPREEIAALVDINFRVKEGEIYGLLGPNGAGKTTLCKIANALVIPTRGHLYISGYDSIQGHNKIRGKIFTIFGGDRDLFGLFQWRVSVEKTLSSWPNCGEFPRQRPREESMDTILKPSEEIGTTVLLTTYNRKEAEIPCDRILLFNKRKISEGTHKELIEKVGALKAERKIIVKIKGKINLKDFDGMAQKNRDSKRWEVLDALSKYNAVNVHTSQVILEEPSCTSAKGKKNRLKITSLPDSSAPRW